MFPADTALPAAEQGISGCKARVADQVWQTLFGRLRAHLPTQALRGGVVAQRKQNVVHAAVEPHPLVYVGLACFDEEQVTGPKPGANLRSHRQSVLAGTQQPYLQCKQEEGGGGGAYSG